MEIFFHSFKVAILIFAATFAIAIVLRLAFSFWFQFWVIPLIQKMIPPSLDDDEE